MDKHGRLLFYVEHFRLSGQGAENDAVRLCQALAERGWELHVAARDADAWPGIVTHPGSFGDLDAVTRAVAPDLTVDWGLFHAADLHRLGGGVHEQFLPYARLARGRLGAWWHDLRQGARDAALAAAERRLLARPGTRILAISRFVAGHAITAGAAPAAVTVLYNGVDTARFAPAGCQARRAAARARWGLGEGEFVFLFVAHNLRLKNFALARQVVARLRRLGWPARLLLVGRRRPLLLPAWVAYAGGVPQVEDAYAAADALLHPTWFDSFANVVLEAMACARPVLVSEFAGAAELLTPGRDGEVLPVQPHRQALAAWTAAAAGLLQAPARARAMGQAARACALAHDGSALVAAFEAELRAALLRRRGDSPPALAKDGAAAIVTQAGPDAPGKQGDDAGR